MEVKASGDSRVEALKVFSGVSNQETRDELPHGKVRGPEVRSALMFIGAFADWRNGMEEYAGPILWCNPCVRHGSVVHPLAGRAGV